MYECIQECSLPSLPPKKEITGCLPIGHMLLWCKGISSVCLKSLRRSVCADLERFQRIMWKKQGTETYSSLTPLGWAVDFTCMKNVSNQKQRAVYSGHLWGEAAGGRELFILCLL